MIVIGLDVHKHSVTALAVDDAGRPLAETTIVVGSNELTGGASASRSRPTRSSDAQPEARGDTDVVNRGLGGLQT